MMPHATPLSRFRRWAVMAWAAMIGGLWAADTVAQKKAATDDVVELERVRVGERGLGRTYLFVEVPGFELLSPFSETLTRAYAKELQRQRAMLGVFLPEVMKSNYDAPQAIFLDDQPPVIGRDNLLIGRTYALSEGAIRQSLAAIRGVPVDPAARKLAAGRGSIVWSRAVSSDSVVSYTSLFGFDYVRQVGRDRIASADGGLTHIFPLASLYEHRRPRWPAWLEDGIDALGARFYAEQTLQFFMLMKLVPPPADLRIEVIFAPPRAAESPEAASLRRQGATVFLHWALLGEDGTGMLGDHPPREAFWRFADRAAREPVTEELLARHFGPDAWDAVLKMWSRSAVHQTRARVPQTLGTYWPQTQPTFPDAAVRRATRAEVVRVKSEYEWRIAREFATAAPELAQQCLDQAGRRLRQAYVDGERDPRFLAVLALFETDAGDPTEARRLIDEAAATGVVRPRIYFQQARFRFLDEKAKLAAPDARFPLDQVRRILEPLEIARRQRPALNEVYQAMTELWLRSAAPPLPEDLEKLGEGPRLFPRDAALAYNIAVLLVRGGQRLPAEEIVTQALRLTAGDAAVHGSLLKLQAAIQEAGPPGRER